MTAIWIWVTAFGLYLIFRGWYDGLAKPLNTAEVEEFMAVLEKRVEAGLHTPDRQTIRSLMENDDGREFIMFDLQTLVDAPAVHPETGEAADPSSLLTSYFRPFMRRMLGKAGHPVITGRVSGGYIDAMNTPVNPCWSGAGLIRYRSRRDAMLASLANSTFDDIYQFKTAAIAQTFALPVQRQVGFYASPRVTVALVVALVAAFLQIILT